MAAAPPLAGEPAVAIPAAAAAPKLPEIEEAARLFRAGDYDNTMRALQEGAKKVPDMPPAEVVMAGWFIAGNQVVMGRTALERAITNMPNDPDAYLLLGDLALRSRQNIEAGLLFEKVQSLTRAMKDPSPRFMAAKRRALAGLATVAEERRDWAAAQTHLEALIAEEPKNAAALQRFGRVLFMQKQKEELALEKLREAAKLDESLLSAEATLAQLYQEAGDVKNAGKWMLEAIKVNPRDAKTRVAAAQWSYEIGKLEQAEEQAKAAVTLDPGSLNCQLIRGAVALLRKDYKTAQEFLEKAHLQAPTNFSATNNLALALASQDNDAAKQLGLEYAQINSRVFPDQAEAFSTLGWALYRLGRLDEAEAHLSKAITMPRATPDTFYYLARIMLDRGRKDNARMLLQTPAMKSSGQYLTRKEAEALLEELSRR